MHPVLFELLKLSRKVRKYYKTKTILAVYQIRRFRF